MPVKLFIILVTAHLLTDYLFQGPRMVRYKQQKRISSFIYHAGIYFFTALCLTVNWLSRTLMFVLFLQTLLHGILDYLKVVLEARHPYFKFEFDIVDLLLHVAVIGSTVAVWTPVYSDISVPLDITIPVESYVKLCVYVSALVLLTRGSTFFVRAVLEKVRSEKQLKADQTGRLIGNIERLLIFVFVLSGSPAAIGFIVTAKSIARFEEIKHKKFAEYYIIGTLTSTLMAILVGQMVIYALEI